MRVSLLTVFLLAGLAARPVAAATTRIPGHVPAVHPGARRLSDAERPSEAGAEPLTLTIVLKRERQGAFEAWLGDVSDPGSPEYRRFLDQATLADRFGPSRATYDRLRRYLGRSGLALVKGSRNRLTLTVRGSRAAVERAFDVRIDDYALGDRTFFANDRDPALPEGLAGSVTSISGLSSLATPRPVRKAIKKAFVPFQCWLQVNYIQTQDKAAQDRDYQTCVANKNAEIDAEKSRRARVAGRAGQRTFTDIDGTGQTVGILAFDRFATSDVADYLALTGAPASQINHLSRIAVNGGATPGADGAEVLLDVNAIMAIAPGADVVVYDAPFAGRGVSFQALFNAMVDDHVDVITNSWAYCEDQTTLADVQGIETILQAAAASGISVFSATGDTGSTCLDGSPNTVAVPASSPSITAVGGSSRTLGPGSVYDAESYWDGATDTPPTGAGGFGVSKFFTRPAYQDGLQGGPMRSVPDVVTNADPALGVLLCQAATGGCPDGTLSGGTSIAAPQWAAVAALLNQAHGSNLGSFNPLLYPLAGTSAFNGPAALGSDFTHVGLGSPNLNALSLALDQQSAGAVNAAASRVTAYLPYVPLTTPPVAEVPADGATVSSVVVRLRDVNDNYVAGKTVSLVANSVNVTISPPTAITTVHDGAAVFEVKSLVAESVDFTVTDTTDGVELAEKPTVVFGVPSAASAGINAIPTSVAADGVATTTITITLQDGLGRPTPGKLIALAQGAAHSVITGPSPAVTDAGGQIQFTATDKVNETVTYTAVDVTDGNLPVPGNPQVTFSGSVGGCQASLVPPVGANGNLITPWATGFVAEDFNFGNVNWMGCPGSSDPAFGASAAFVADFRTGDLFKLGLDGGAVSSADALINLGQTLGQPRFGKDGHLYATRSATTGNFTTGALYELDTTTGAIVRTVASNLTCPAGLAVDPLSGDLFFTDACTGAGSDDPSVKRVIGPASATPTVVTYATLPFSPNGGLAFAPNGTLYAVAHYYLNENAPVYRITGTDKPAPHTPTLVDGVDSNFSIAVAHADANGEATAFLVASNTTLELIDVTTTPPTKTILANGTIGAGTIGPDGCLYSSGNDRVSKLTDGNGGCGFLATNPAPALALSPATVTPAATQGTVQTFTATFQHAAVPVDTPIFVSIDGANPDVRVLRTDASGGAVLALLGTVVGDDTIVASAVVDGNVVTSNAARVTWVAGKHVTFLTLNPSTTTGVPGESVMVTASLTDVSQQPPVAAPGVEIHFALGGSECTAMTDANGLASCQLVLGEVGRATLAATFAGTPGLVDASDAIGFSIVGAALGNFTVYQTSPAKGAAKLFKLGPVTLADAFGSAGYDVVKALGLGIPTSANGGGIADAATALAAYAVKPTKGAPKFAARPDVQVLNQCGGVTATFTKPVELLVPAAEDPNDPVTAPVEADHNVDHLLCYKVKAQKKLSGGTPVATLPKKAQVDLADAFETRRYDLKKVAMVCLPVAKSGSPTLLAGPNKGAAFPLTPSTVRNPGSELVCYGAKLASKTYAQNGCGPADPKDKGTKLAQAKTTARLLHVADQLETTSVQTKKATIVCLPSSLAP